MQTSPCLSVIFSTFVNFCCHHVLVYMYHFQSDLFPGDVFLSHKILHIRPPGVQGGGELKKKTGTVASAEG